MSLWPRHYDQFVDDHARDMLDLIQSEGFDVHVYLGGVDLVAIEESDEYHQLMLLIEATVGGNVWDTDSPAGRLARSIHQRMYEIYRAEVLGQ